MPARVYSEVIITKRGYSYATEPVPGSALGATDAHRPRKLLCSDKNYMFVLMECKAGTAQPPHSHPHTQVDYLLEGEIDMQVGDEVRRMHAGDIVQVPGNVPHAFCRVYQDTRWLEFFTPAREDILPREEQKEKE